MTRRRRLIQSLAVGAALVIGAAACGSSGSGEASGKQVTVEALRAAATSTEQQSARFTMDMTVKADGQSIDMSAEGVTSGDGRSGEVTMDLMGMGTMRVKIVDGTLYYDFGALSALIGIPEGKWVAIDPAAASSLSGTDFEGLLEQAERTSGTQQGLSMLQSLSGDVQEIGTDEINGGTATHYRAQLDYAKLAADSGLDAETTAALTKLGTVPVDVWIDDEDRVVRVWFKLDASALGETGVSGEVTLKMDISDFGVPVDVVAPSADQTVPFSEISGALGAGIPS